MVLLFDLGATHARFCLSVGGQIGEVMRMDTDNRREGFDNWLKTMGEHAGDSMLEAVVGGMAGQIDDAGRLTDAPNLPEWAGVAVLERLKEQFDCPVFVHNDVVMGGLGEAYDGAGSPHGVMVYFTISTGVNAVRIIDGRADDTIDRFEIGHQLVKEIGSGRETLESVLGGAATKRLYGQAPEQLRRAALWHQDAQTLARVVYNTALYWSPDIIVFGGSMMNDIKVAEIKRGLAALPQLLACEPKLARATLGDRAGLHGALRWWNLRQKPA